MGQAIYARDSAVAPVRDGAEHAGDVGHSAGTQGLHGVEEGACIPGLIPVGLRAQEDDDLAALG